MRQLEIELRELLIGAPPIKIMTEEEMEEFGEIVDAHREISYGQVEVSDEGKITSLIIDLEAILENNDVSLDEYEELSAEDLKEIAQDFVDEYGQKNLQLTSFSEWGNQTFLLTFEAMDVQYQIPLPDSGATIEMNKQGFVLSATFNQSYYQLTHPKLTVDADVALMIYKNRMLVELAAFQQEDEIRLMYYPKNLNEVVGANGDIISLNQFLENGPVELEKVPPVMEMYDEAILLGITPDMNKVEEENTVTYEQSDQHYVKFDMSDEHQLIIDSTLPFKEGDEYTLDELRKRAIAFLESKVGNVSEHYLLEDAFVEEDLEDDEDDELTEEEIEMLKALSAEDGEDEEEDDEDDSYAFEPFVTFTFHRYINGIPLSEYTANIDMGIYSGRVTDAVIPMLKEEHIENMSMEPTITLEEANEIYKDSIKMELARVPYEDEEFTKYELCYVVKEKEVGQRIERIDAENGNIFYYDQLDDIEYEE